MFASMSGCSWDRMMEWLWHGQLREQERRRRYGKSGPRRSMERERDRIRYAAVATSDEKRAAKRAYKRDWYQATKDQPLRRAKRIKDGRRVDEKRRETKCVYMRERRRVGAGQAQP